MPLAPWVAPDDGLVAGVAGITNDKGSMMTEHNETEAGGAGREWERRVLTDLATAGLREQRRARRWGIFFKLLTFAYLILLLGLLSDVDWKEAASTGKHSAVVDLKGLIAPGTNAEAKTVIKGLRAAFDNDKTVGVILRINSPGGSPVQARYINAEIGRLRKAHPDIPVYAAIADVGASGAYYVAVAADKIYVDESSLVGSIGVRMDGFGFDQAIDKLGVQRRLLTAGEHKALLDPFLPLKQFDQTYVQSLLDDIHGQFIAAVRAGRGERLREDQDEDLFSGLIWTGDRAVELGLADATGDADYVAREVIGEETIVDYTKKRDWLERLSEQWATALGRGLGAQLLPLQGAESLY